MLSFHNTGILDSEEEANNIYMRIVASTLFCIVIASPSFGFFSDVADPRYTIPVSFGTRAIFGACIWLVKDPRETYSYILCVIVAVSSAMQFITVEAYFLRHMKPQIRGTLIGFGMFFGSIGVTTFALTSGKLFDQVGPWAPFMLLSLCDIIVVIISIIFSACKLIKGND